MPILTQMLPLSPPSLPRHLSGLGSDLTRNGLVLGQAWTMTKGIAEQMMVVECENPTFSLDSDLTFMNLCPHACRMFLIFHTCLARRRPRNINLIRGHADIQLYCNRSIKTSPTHRKRLYFSLRSPRI